MMERSANGDSCRALTSNFSLSSRASFSFFRRSLISLSLTTQAAAPSAAASGCDLFRSKSTIRKKEKRYVSKDFTPTNAPAHAQARETALPKSHS